MKTPYTRSTRNGKTDHERDITSETLFVPCGICTTASANFFFHFSFWFRFVFLVGRTLRHGRCFAFILYPRFIDAWESMLLQQRRFHVVTLCSSWRVSSSPEWMGGFRRTCSCYRCPLSTLMRRLCAFVFTGSIVRRPLHAAAAWCFGSA